jgi:polygalacturonase
MKVNAGLLIIATICIIAWNSTNKHSITDYGAIADGKTNNAISIQKAIDEVSKNGGGQVIVPPGNFLTSTIFLKSGVDLHLEAGACLMGPSVRNAYKLERAGLIEA